MKKGIIFLALCALSISAAAQQESYIGGNLSFLDYSETGLDDASLTAAVAKLGNRINDNIAAEFRLGFGLGSDEVDVQGIPVDLELDNLFGVYVKGGMPLAQNLYPYAVLGYTRAKLTATAYGNSFSDSETDISFGFGLDLKTASEVTFSAEYMNYFDKDEVEISGFSLSVSKNF